MIKIKKYEDRFNSQVGKLHVQTFNEIGQKISDWNEMCKQKLPCLVAINEKEEVVGYAVYQIYHSVLYFNWFGVSSKFRGKGIGQKLLREVIKKAKEDNAKIIEVRSRNRFNSALCLYLKNDFMIEGTYLQNDKEMMIVLRKRNLT
jgi:ribosomal protein S18 acetylase RimI-like enzyme